MARISELRNRAGLTEELKEASARRIQKAVKDVVTSDPFTLTIINQMSSSEDNVVRTKGGEDLIAHIANEVTKRVTDSVEEFLEICRARGLQDYKIEKAVNTINTTFGLIDSKDYNEKLKAVADYMSANRYLYEDIALLTN